MAFDVGTTAVKVGVYTTRGKCLFSQALAYNKFHRNPGWVEQKPSDWIDCIHSLLEQVQQQFDPNDVLSVGICSQVNTHVFVNHVGRALCDAIVWEDQRCFKIAGDLDARYKQVAGGGALEQSSLVSRAAWVRQNMPDVWDNTAFVLSPKDFCISYLTGHISCDALSSVGLVGSSGAYLEEVIGLVPGLDSRLPPVRELTHVVGRVKTGVHGLSPGTPVVNGTMDCWASLFGSGAFAPGRGFQVAGTSEILGLVSTQNKGGSGVVSFPPYQELHLHAGPTQASGDALRWYADTQNSSVEALLAIAQAVPAHQDPIVFLPYLMGERAPIWDSKAKGAFIGLTKRHGEPSMVRAIMEGVGFSARHLLEHLEVAAGFRTDSLVISGGASRSDLWCQIKADIMNIGLHRAENTDTGTFGAALIAAAAVGVYSSLDEAVSHGVAIERVFEPQNDAVAHYERLYALYL